MSLQFFPHWVYFERKGNGVQWLEEIVGKKRISNNSNSVLHILSLFDLFAYTQRRLQEKYVQYHKSIKLGHCHGHCKNLVM